ncbi:GTP cyclohydrolase II [Methylophaga frappieri]|uniref:GTP cyclohydrolase II n=1 Tax=Methylophaga frappieri (strain ATCC BAA-2434 / DSM 25690 / JAM7) TaxID=754477 RepID=I1YLM3_METFJ|nr:GTP cyclohydrolase II [Methylophaga frappieri]AFJ03816.1 GTP cyclohydrolase II [Methylophaga frappieri]
MAKIRQSVPLKVGAAQVDAEIISFFGLESGLEHIAIKFVRKSADVTSPIIRIHSECLTGDIFHSSRCDCGEQLEESLSLLDNAGGILLYLRQEGRGIGLYNKLDAYALQDSGLNTYEANVRLGFAEDQRQFSEAAEMLKALDIDRVQLITNNPVKREQLEANGIIVEKTIPTSAHTKPGNLAYLKAKQAQGKHSLNLNEDPETEITHFID